MNSKTQNRESEINKGHLSFTFCDLLSQLMEFCRARCATLKVGGGEGGLTIDTKWGGKGG